MSNGHIFAHITCDRVKWEDEDGEPVEDGIVEYGWIDRSWSPYVLHDSRNDARPIVDLPEDDEDLEDEVRDALGWLEGGYVDNGDGTFYSADSYQPYTEPWNYSYAIHFIRKGPASEGFQERPWHPRTDGNIEL